jgi:N-acetylmuramoyl-L-alanine amidase
MKICLDSGHGMSNRTPGKYDGGAESAGVYEADIALDTALSIKYLCAQAGIEVFLTRTNKTDPDPVGTRAARANSAGCDLFLSIHCNAGDGRATGTETFYRDERDRRLASVVQACALGAYGLKSRGLKTEAASQHSRLAVFSFVGPCALAELGFIDNPRDRAAMLDREKRIAFASALVTHLKAGGIK